MKKKEMTKNQQAIHALKSPFGMKVSYTMAQFGINALWAFVGSFMTLYYTDSVGLSAAFVGTMMLICRVFDGFSDLLMGMLIDKTRSRWGKARPWILFSALPFALSFFFLFRIPASMSLNGKNVYAFVSYFLLSVIFYTIAVMATTALLPRFSLTSSDRTTVSVMGTIVGMLANIIVSSLVPALFAGDYSNQAHWSKIVFIIAVLVGICQLIAFFGIRERVKDEEENTEKKVKKSNTGEELLFLLKGKYFYILIFLFMAYSVMSGTTGVNIYYAKDVLGNDQMMSLMTLAGFVPLLVGIPFSPILFKKFGKRNSMMMVLILSTVCSLLQWISPKNAIFFLALTAVKGLCNAPFATALQTLVGDVIDYNAWKYNIRNEGITSSVASIGQKIGTGLGAAILGWGLAIGNYEGNATVQPDSAIFAIMFIAIGVAALVTFISAVLLWFWDIEKYQSEILDFMQKKSIQE